MVSGALGDNGGYSDTSGQNGGQNGVQPRRITMSDVAQLAGCSQATVSVVLNNASGVKISGATPKIVRPSV